MSGDIAASLRISLANFISADGSAAGIMPASGTSYGFTNTNNYFNNICWERRQHLPQHAADAESCPPHNPRFAVNGVASAADATAALAI